MTQAVHKCPSHDIVQTFEGVKIHWKTCIAIIVALFIQARWGEKEPGVKTAVNVDTKWQEISMYLQLRKATW